MEGKCSAQRYSGTQTTALPNIQSGETTGVQTKQKVKDGQRQICIVCHYSSLKKKKEERVAP